MTRPGTPAPSQGGSGALPDGGVTLLRLRTEIEEVDAALVELLARRVRLAREGGLAKRGAGLPVLDPEREAAVVRRGVVLARERGLDPEAVRAIFWRVVGMCREAQSQEGGAP